jgi:hypothetical protein
MAAAKKHRGRSRSRTGTPLPRAWRPKPTGPYGRRGHQTGARWTRASSSMFHPLLICGSSWMTLVLAFHHPVFIHASSWSTLVFWFHPWLLQSHPCGRSTVWTGWNRRIAEYIWTQSTSGWTVDEQWMMMLIFIRILFDGPAFVIKPRMPAHHVECVTASQA